jgi:hypothetical protein
MLNQNHPDDERLSALASRETDATADTALTAHVSSCDRCTEVVDELGALRIALADLPDLRPPRPLQLVPPAEVSVLAADRVGGWARRFFAPVLASGAALALVGVIGTAAPALNNMASGPQVGAPAQEQAGAQASAPAASEAPAAAEASGETFESAGGAISGDGVERDPVASPNTDDFQATASEEVRSPLTFGGDDAAPGQSPSPGRSPWPMVLFAGIALIVAAGLMRWILAPRAA